MEAWLYVCGGVAVKWRRGYVCGGVAFKWRRGYMCVGAWFLRGA